MAETALYQNRPFWIGCADRDTGKIEEVHTYEEAERAGFHTCLYFSEQQETRNRQGDNIYFWIEEDGIIQFDANGLGPEKTGVITSPVRVNFVRLTAGRETAVWLRIFWRRRRIWCTCPMS